MRQVSRRKGGGEDEAESVDSERALVLTCSCSPWYTSSFRAMGMSSTTSSKLVMYLVRECGGGGREGGGRRSGCDAQALLALPFPPTFDLPLPQALVQVTHDARHAYSKLVNACGVCKCVLESVDGPRHGEKVVCFLLSSSLPNPTHTFPAHNTRTRTEKQGCGGGKPCAGRGKMCLLLSSMRQPRA